MPAGRGGRADTPAKRVQTASVGSDVGPGRGPSSEETPPDSGQLSEQFIHPNMACRPIIPFVRSVGSTSIATEMRMVGNTRGVSASRERARSTPS